MPEKYKDKMATAILFYILAVMVPLSFAEKTELTGPIKDVFNGPCLYVYGTQGTDSKGNEAVKEYVIGIAAFANNKLGKSWQVKSDLEVSAEDMDAYNLILYGTPTNHRILSAIVDALPVRFTDSRIILGDLVFEGPRTRLIMAYPNPLCPQRYILIYSALSLEAIHGINRIFHGPSDFEIVGHSGLKYSGNFNKDGGVWQRQFVREGKRRRKERGKTLSDILSQHPNVLAGWYSKSRRIAEDLADEISGQLFYDVNFLGEYGDIIVVGEPYSNAYIVELEQKGLTKIAVTRDYPGEEIGVVQFIGPIEDFSTVTLVSGSDSSGVRIAVQYLEQVYRGETGLRNGGAPIGSVLFLGESGGKIEEIEREWETKPPDLDKGSQVLSSVAGSMVLETAAIEEALDFLRGENTSLEKAVEDTVAKEKLAMAWMRYDHPIRALHRNAFIEHSPQGIAPSLILADMLSPKLQEAAMEVYQGSGIGSCLNLGDYNKARLIHIAMIIKYSGNPWNAKNYSAYRKECAHEMFGFREDREKAAGDCYAIACFNAAVLRLCGLSPDQVYTLWIGTSGGGHAVDLVRLEHAFILDGTVLSYPLFDHYGGGYTVFRGVGNDERYCYFSDASNIEASEVNEIKAEVFQLLNPMKTGERTYLRPNPWMVEGNLRISVRDVIPAPGTSIAGTSLDFPEAKERLRKAAARLLTERIYHFILEKAIAYPQSQYPFSRYAAGLIHVKKPQAYAYATLLGCLTEEAAYEIDSRSPQGDVAATIEYLEGIQPHEGFENRFAFPDYLMITKVGCPRDKALLAYGLLGNMKKGKDYWKDLYVVVTDESSYLAYKDEGWDFMDCGTNEVLEGLPSVKDIRLVFNEDACYFPEMGVTSADIVRTIEAWSTTTIVREKLPEVFALFQNYPNPFNPSTTIRFELPKSGRVDLSVFNVLGQKVRTLISGKQTSGRYSVIWDGGDGRGVRAGSGVYFYRLKAEDSVNTRKMVVLD